MAGVRGKTGNPGAKNPKKKNLTSFAVESNEPRGKAMSFRPVQSLEKRISEVLVESGLKATEFLELAAIAYLEKDSEEILQDLEQLNLEKRQLDSGSSTEEPATTASDETPASGSRDTRGQEQQAGDTKPSSKSKRSPRTGTKIRKTPSS